MSVRNATGLMFMDISGQLPDMSVNGYRGVASSEAAADVKVSSSFYEFLFRHTRGRVSHPAGGLIVQTCFGHLATEGKIGNVSLISSEIITCLISTFLKLVVIKVCISLCGLDRLMAKKMLNVVYCYTFIHQC